MGFRIVLETERGACLAEVGDPKNYLHKLLPAFDDPSFLWLRYIDWYANTVFNSLQIVPFLEEWRRLSQRASSEEERDILRHVEVMALDVQREEHRYLKFYGD